MNISVSDYVLEDLSSFRRFVKRLFNLKWMLWKVCFAKNSPAVVCEPWRVQKCCFFFHQHILGLIRGDCTHGHHFFFRFWATMHPEKGRSLWNTVFFSAYKNLSRLQEDFKKQLLSSARSTPRAETSNENREQQTERSRTDHDRDDPLRVPGHSRRPPPPDWYMFPSCSTNLWKTSHFFPLAFVQRILAKFLPDLISEQLYKKHRTFSLVCFQGRAKWSFCGWAGWPRPAGRRDGRRDVDGSAEGTWPRVPRSKCRSSRQTAQVR